MGTSSRGGLRSRTFALFAGAIVAVVIVQSVVHILFTVDLHHRRSLFDLDRSNGIPDLVSTGVLGLATLGAALVALYEHGVRRVPPAVAAFTLGALTLADLVHDGAHPARNTGKVVVLLAALTLAMTFLVVLGAFRRARVTFAVGVGLLACSFMLSQVREFDPTFDWRHGQRAHELRIVAKEGFELAGWALIGLMLWDVCLARRPHRVESAAAAEATRLEPRSDP